MTTLPKGNVLCEGDLKGNHFVVRDSGILNLEGTGLCRSLLSASQ